MKRKQFYTITEAAKKLGITRAAVHRAIKQHRLEAEWGETIQLLEIKKRTWKIPIKSIEHYRVNIPQQERGKKA